jgi:hypothetical protein
MQSALLTMGLFLGLLNMSWAASGPDITTLSTLSPIGVTTKGYTVSVRQYNGRFWNQLTTEQKGVFIGGLLEGVVAYYITSGVATTPKQSEYEKIKDSYFADGFIPPEMANVIDDIYKDNSNLRIPISEVLRVAVRKAKGLSQLGVEDLLSELRRQFVKQE